MTTRCRSFIWQRECEKDKLHVPPGSDTTLLLIVAIISTSVVERLTPRGHRRISHHSRKQDWRYVNERRWPVIYGKDPNGRVLNHYGKYARSRSPGVRDRHSERLDRCLRVYCVLYGLYFAIVNGTWPLKTSIQHTSTETITTVQYLIVISSIL